MAELTVEEIKQGIEEYSVKEVVAALVGLTVASQEAHAEYGDDIEAVPEPLKNFIKRFIEVAEENGA